VSILVRKINKGKWKQNDIVNGARPSADAITNCLRTKGNKLSTWSIEEEEKVEEAVLAIISHPKFEHLESIDVALIDREDIEARGISLNPSRAQTSVQFMADRHYDLMNLCYDSLGIIADLIIDSFRKNRVKRFTKVQLKKILIEAEKNSHIDRDDLNDNIAKEITNIDNSRE